MPDPVESKENEPIVPGTPAEPNTPVEPKTPKEESYELVVDGEKRAVTLDEMKQLAQKASGADKRFQEASDLKKEAEDGIRIKSLIDRLSNTDTPSEAEIKEIASMIGVDPNEFAQYLAAEEKPTPADKNTPAAASNKLSKEEIVEALGFDPAEAKSILEFSHQRHIEATRQKIRENSDEVVDKDEIFGKMKIGDGGEDRLAVVKDMVAEDVLRKIQDGGQFGAELVAASVQKIRAHLTKFGMPNKLDVYPLTLGLGPGGSLPSEVQSENPIERISAAEDDSEDNFVKRAMQKGLQMLRNKQSK